jgi:hypothetical protein
MRRGGKPGLLPDGSSRAYRTARPANIANGGFTEQRTFHQDLAMTQYVRDTLALLGDTDPLSVLAETPAIIAAQIAGLSDAALHQPEGDGKWSITQVMAHLADSEIAYGWRSRIMLTQHQPPLHGFDENAWMLRFNCASADPIEALQTFTALRGWNMRVWSCATGDDLKRMGVHAQRGPESFDLLRRLAAGHDLRHRRQIDRIVKVVR